MSDIDFVVLWVDSTDVAWQEKFTEFKGKVATVREPSTLRGSGIWVSLNIGSDVSKNMRHG